MHVRFAIGCAVVSMMGCGSAESGSGSTSNGDGTNDVRVAVPPADPAFIDFVSPEITVEPGKEQMDCVHFRYDGDEIAVSDVESLQGKFGHHAILLGALQPKPNGTREDCSRAEDMTKFDAWAIPVALPAGHGVYLPKGKNLVLQTHYVNTSKAPIRIRDVVRLKKRPIAEVTTWAAPFATNTVAMKLAPRAESTFSFDCTMPVGGALLLVGGHMHEQGTKFKVEHGASVTSLKSLYSTDWKVEYRDVPPITMMMSDPYKVEKGSIVRTTCTWFNAQDKPLEFPEEMCASFGYITGQREAVVCRDGEAR